MDEIIIKCELETVRALIPFSMGHSSFVQMDGNPTIFAERASVHQPCYNPYQYCFVKYDVMDSTLNPYVIQEDMAYHSVVNHVFETYSMNHFYSLYNLNLPKQ